MFDAEGLFKQRFTEHMKTLSRYFQYILNGHTTIALLFLISVGAVYYQQWLSTLPDGFQYAYVLGIAFGLVVTITLIQTFLKEPELVFLTVAERKMKHYFKRTKLYSYVIQLYLIFLIITTFDTIYLIVYLELN